MDRVLGLVLAGGRVDELQALTEKRPKAALPVFGCYRFIDFALSNLMHAGVRNVGVLSQYRPYSLMRHIGTGEHWDFVGRSRGIRLLPPYRGLHESDWYKGTADAVYQNLSFIDEFKPRDVLIVAADHVYRMDYRPLVKYHRERKADATVSFAMLRSMHSRFGYGVLGSEGKLTKYVEKPETPPSNLVSMTVYLFRTDVLKEALRTNARDATHEFGQDIIPLVMKANRVFGYRFKGYWSYARTVQAYVQTNRDLIRGRIDLKQWQIRTNLLERCVRADRLPAWMADDVRHSVISEGCRISGSVRNSVLSPGVVVEPGARIIDSIVFHDVVVGGGAVVRGAICDKDVRIGREAVISGESDHDQGKKPECATVIIGKGMEIPPGTQIGAGSVLYSSATDVPPDIAPGSVLR